MQVQSEDITVAWGQQPHHLDQQYGIFLYLFTMYVLNVLEIYVFLRFSSAFSSLECKARSVAWRREFSRDPPDDSSIWPPAASVCGNMQRHVMRTTRFELFRERGRNELKIDFETVAESPNLPSVSLTPGCYWVNAPHCSLFREGDKTKRGRERQSIA